MTIESIQIIEALRFGLKPFNEIDSFNEQSSIYAIAFNGDEFPVHLDLDKINKGDIIGWEFRNNSDTNNNINAISNLITVVKLE